jgi:hypothetical protein
MSRFRPPLNVEAAPFQRPECPLGALFHLCCFVGMPVTIRRRIDEDQKRLLAAMTRLYAAATLRADINCRLVRQCVAAEDVVEFGLVVTREKHVMQAEREAVGPCDDTPRHR